MTWVPDPNLIVQRFASGTGNMGVVTAATNRLARFTPPGKSILVKAHTRFRATSDQGTATLKMWQDSHRGGDGIDSLFDRMLADWATVGWDAAAVSTFADWGLSESWDGLRHIFWPGDELVFTWTDPGATAWGIEVAWLPLPGGEANA